MSLLPGYVGGAIEIVQVWKCCSAGWVVPGVPLGTDVGGALGPTPVAWVPTEEDTMGDGVVYPEGSTYWGWVPTEGTTEVWDTMGGKGL